MRLNDFGRAREEREKGKRLHAWPCSSIGRALMLMALTFHFALLHHLLHLLLLLLFFLALLLLNRGR